MIKTQGEVEAGIDSSARFCSPYGGDKPLWDLLAEDALGQFGQRFGIGAPGHQRLQHGSAGDTQCAASFCTSSAAQH